jgi:hypothetical protein
MKFPVLWIAKEGSFGVIHAPMKDGSFVAYRNGFFDGLRFFDSSGTEWEVRAAVPKRKPGALDRLLNRRIGMELQIGPPRQPALAEVAELLCSCVDRDPDDIYDQFVTHDELKAHFRAAASAPELIERAGNLGEEAEHRLPRDDQLSE